MVQQIKLEWSPHCGLLCAGLHLRAFSSYGVAQ